MSINVYQMVTDRIIAELEKGNIPWEKPWTGVQSGAISGTTGKAYSLLNQMILGKSGSWFTWNQIQSKGWKIRKGERASFVVFWKNQSIKETDKQTGEEIEKVIPILKYFNVFHESQLEGYEPTPVDTKAVDPATDITADAIIADYINRSGVTLEHRKGDEAFYSPSADCVVLPLREQFPDMAEIGAASLLSYVGIETSKSFRNSTAYIQSWLRVLRNDSRFIVSAASRAEKAVNLILG